MKILYLTIVSLIILISSITIVSVFIYNKIKKSTSNKRVLSYNELHSYISDAKSCEKDNSPVVGENFYSLLTFGTQLSLKEHFNINDVIVERSDYRVC